ncbi:hypothetical protein J8N05_32365 [Streptomyces sp. BH-SS-21]|uniref:Uncharacterized protein n=1 Tax=Streptomyces liliiviolaceus TaxID=2823109 RepID=A0A941B9M2_9ACTN|nr:hypothetical protein [Streptomyces liliiviolaceus]MBQ0852866.1 hypothetical protein [Streptomyces liliiviolaceus]
MWAIPDVLARRFPLIARPRPPTLPLPQRVRALAELAARVAKTGDASIASTVYNQAALIASDTGMPDVARALCRQHAAAYLDAAPLSGRAAIRALEPVVNLARLDIRAGHYADGRHRLLQLFDAVSTSVSIAVFEDIVVPPDLTSTASDRQEIRAWLWRVLLADGTRALTAAGRWTEALAHVEAHHGVGQRMLDGRQVAVLAALSTGNTGDANNLLNDTKPGEPWEEAVTDCLTAMCHRATGLPWERTLQNLVTTYLGHQEEEALTVFYTRLGLAVLDVIASPERSEARLVAEELHRRAIKASDGYAVRDILAHPLCAALATDREAQDCRTLLTACALGAGTLTEELRGQLDHAVRTSDHTIRESLARQDHSYPIGQE